MLSLSTCSPSSNLIGLRFSKPSAIHHRNGQTKQILMRKTPLCGGDFVRRFAISEHEREVEMVMDEQIGVGNEKPAAVFTDSAPPAATVERQMERPLEDLEPVINRWSKWLLAFLIGTSLLWKRDMEAAWFLMGASTNSWLSVALKHIFNHERPEVALRSDPGMPSSHAQCIFHSAVYAFLSITHWLGFSMFTASLGVFILACSSYISWLRISQRLHTTGQVIVGAAVGSTFGTLWFNMWHSFVVRASASSAWVRTGIFVGSVATSASFMFLRQQRLDEERT